MKKDGDWIATRVAYLQVGRVDIEANEVLDLVEVTEVDRVSGRPMSVRFFDRVEGARYRDQLSAALESLGEWTIEDTTTNAPVGPIYKYEKDA